MNNNPRTEELVNRVYFDHVFTATSGALTSDFKAATHGLKYDTVIGTGLSGTIFVARVASALRKKFAIVRKPDDKSTHSSNKIEGMVGTRYIFADDFISSGTTMRRVLEYMADHHPQAEFVGAYSYTRGVFEGVEELAYQYGKWVSELSYGPAFGPETYDTWKANNPVSVPLRAPRGGWDESFRTKLPLPEPRRLEITWEDEGKPAFYCNQNGFVYTESNDPRVKVYADLVREETRTFRYNELIGRRVHRLRAYTRRTQASLDAYKYAMEDAAKAAPNFVSVARATDQLWAEKGYVLGA